MAFPSNLGGVKSLAPIWQQVTGLAGAVKQRATNLRAAALAGSITAEQILALAALLATSKVQFAEAAAVPGMAAYAQAQVGNPALNVVTEFSAMTAEIDATISWVRTNLPNDGTYALVVITGADGTYSWRSFTPAQTAGFRTRLDALVALID